MDNFRTPMSNYTSSSNLWQPYKDDVSYLQIGDDNETTLTPLHHIHEDRMHFWVVELLTTAIKSAL